MTNSVSTCYGNTCISVKGKAAEFVAYALAAALIAYAFYTTIKILNQNG